MNKEIIEDGKNGFLVKGEDQWVNILCQLIEDKSLRESVGKEGRKTVVEKYSKNIIKSRYLEIYTSLIK